MSTHHSELVQLGFNWGSGQVRNYLFDIKSVFDKKITFTYIQLRLVSSISGKICHLDTPRLRWVSPPKVKLVSYIFTNYSWSIVLTEKLLPGVTEFCKRRWFTCEATDNTEQNFDLTRLPSLAIVLLANIII